MVLGISLASCSNASVNWSSSVPLQVKLASPSLDVCPGTNLSVVVTGGVPPYALTASTPTGGTITSANVITSGASPSFAIPSYLSDPDVTVSATDVNGQTASLSVPLSTSVSCCNNTSDPCSTASYCGGDGACHTGTSPTNGSVCSSSGNCAFGSTCTNGNGQTSCATTSSLPATCASSATCAVGSSCIGSSCVANAAILTAIRITPGSTSIANGNSVPFTASATYSDNSTADVTALVTWTGTPATGTGITPGSASLVSSGVNVGLATGTGVGTVTITATLGTVSGTATLTVTSAVLTSFSISAASNSVANGLSDQLTATGTFSDRTTGPVTSLVSWSVTSGPGSIGGSTGILITGSGIGTVQIQASYPNLTTQTAGISVTAATLVSFTILPGSSSVPNGSTDPLTATGTFSDRTTDTVTSLVSWSVVSGPGLIGGSTGILTTGSGTGTVQIQATYPNLTAQTASVMVTAATLVSFTVSPASTSVSNGLTDQLTATGTFSDNSTGTVTSLVSWSVVSGPGFIGGSTGILTTGSGTGTVQIQATYPNLTTQTTSVSVTAAVLTSFTISPASSSIANGLTDSFTATGIFSDNSTGTVTSLVAWSVTSGPATIGGSTGILNTDLGTGTAQVQATYPNLATQTASVSITAATLVSFTITAVNSSVPNGSTDPITALGTFTDGSSGPATSLVTWNVTSGPASIDATTGILTAASSGTGTVLISASYPNLTTQTTSVNVTAPTFALTISPSSLSLPVGQSQLLTVSGTTSSISWIITSTGGSARMVENTVVGTLQGTVTLTATADAGSETSAPYTMSVTAGTPYYIADSTNNIIRKVASDGTISIAAGITPSEGGSNAIVEINPNPQTMLSISGFEYPNGIAVDSSGKMYISDPETSQIDLATPGIIDVIAGIGGGSAFNPTGPAIAASLQTPKAVAVDVAGNFYMANPGEKRVEMVPANSGTYFGQAMTANYLYTIMNASSEQYSAPMGVAVDLSGNVYVTDQAAQEVLMIPSRTGTYFGQQMVVGSIFAIAGTGTPQYTAQSGVATSTDIDSPTAITVDSSGNVYFTQEYGVSMLPVTSGNFFGQQMTAGDLYNITGGIVQGYSGDTTAATSAAFAAYPLGIAVDGSGNLYVADTANAVIRLISTAGIITTVAGTAGTNGYAGDNGAAVSAIFRAPAGVAVAPPSLTEIMIASSTTTAVVGSPVAFTATGTFSDSTTHDITSLVTWTSGTSSTATIVTGTGIATAAGPGTTSISASVGTLVSTNSVTLSVTLPQFYIGDSAARVVQLVSNNVMSTVAGVLNTSGSASPAGSSATNSAAFTSPHAIAIDRSGNIFVSDTSNNQISVVMNVSVSGSFFGISNPQAGNIYEILAPVNTPTGLAVDLNGNLYVADQGNLRVIMVSASSAQISIIDSGSTAYGVAVDNLGNVYATESGSGGIVKMIVMSEGTYFGQSLSQGSKVIIAGGDTTTSAVSAVSANSATLTIPQGIAVDGWGNVFINQNDGFPRTSVIVNGSTYLGQTVTPGFIYTIAGTGISGYSNDGGAATAAELYNPEGIAVDEFDDVFIADRGNLRVRMVSAATGIISTVAGNGNSGSSTTATSASLESPIGVALAPPSLMATACIATFTGTSTEGQTIYNNFTISLNGFLDGPVNVFLNSLTGTQISSTYSSGLPLELATTTANSGLLVIQGQTNASQTATCQIPMVP